MECEVWQVAASYEQKPYRRTMMEVWGATVHPSPSEVTDFGRQLLAENPDEVHQGGDNLRKQLENMAIHGVTPVVAINAFPGDHQADIAAIAEIAGVNIALGRRRSWLSHAEETANRAHDTHHPAQHH